MTVFSSKSGTNLFLWYDTHGEVHWNAHVRPLIISVRMYILIFRFDVLKISLKVNIKMNCIYFFIMHTPDLIVKIAFYSKEITVSLYSFVKIYYLALHLKLISFSADISKSSFLIPSQTCNQLLIKSPCCFRPIKSLVALNELYE